MKSQKRFHLLAKFLQQEKICRCCNLVLQTKKIERDWILVTYDISTDLNNQRDIFRDDLRDKMGAIYQNDSVYLLPKKIHSIEEIKRFARSYGVNIVLFGLDADLQTCKSISKRYVQDLRDRRKDVKELCFEAWERILQAEKADEGLTGFHNVVKEIEEELSKFRFLINRYGNKHDEWKLESLVDDYKRVKRRYEKVMEHRHRFKKEK